MKRLKNNYHNDDFRFQRNKSDCKLGKRYGSFDAKYAMKTFMFKSVCFTAILRFL